MGNISIDNDVIAQYAGNVANECFGIVGMAGVNMKEGIVNLLKKDTMTRGIDVTLTPRNRLVIDFHVIVSYGVNITTVADNLIETVRYNVEVKLEIWFILNINGGIIMIEIINMKIIMAELNL